MDLMKHIKTVIIDIIATNTKIINHNFVINLVVKNFT